VAQEKRIPAAKLGKEWRFRKSIVDRWLDEQILSSESGFEYLKKQPTDLPPYSGRGGKRELAPRHAGVHRMFSG